METIKIKPSLVYHEVTLRQQTAIFHIFNNPEGVAKIYKCGRDTFLYNSD